MMYSDLFNRISALETKLREIEITKFGKEPDETIIANLHASLVVDLCGLIVRAGRDVTPEGKHMARKQFSNFEHLTSSLLKDFPNMERVYVETITDIREVYKDVLLVYEQG